MLDIDDRRVLHFHLFVTALVIVVCGGWMACVPYGAIYFVEEVRGRGWHYDVALLLLRSRGFGLGFGGFFALAIITGYWLGWFERRMVKICWLAIVVILGWFSACMYFLWPAMKIVGHAGFDLLT